MPNETLQFRHFLDFVNVTNILESFITEFNGSTLAIDVFNYLMTEAYEMGLDPLAEVCLVKNEGTGFFTVRLEDIETPGDQPIIKFCEPINTENIISSDTSLTKALEIFHYKPDIYVLYVIKECDIIGYLSYNSLLKPPLRICLLSLIMNLEVLMARVAGLKPSESFLRLNQNRRLIANQRYIHNGYNFNNRHEPYPRLLIDCTSLSDKFSMLMLDNNVAASLPCLNHNDKIRWTKIIRDELAHPISDYTNSSSLDRQILWPNINWLETLIDQLNDYLFSNNAQLDF